MAIKVGDRIPKATLKRLTPEGMKDIHTDEFFKGRKVVLFAVPGAFTPTCSAKHLPGFVEQADKIKAKGVSEIVCVSVNDAFVMDSWAKDRNVGNKVTLLADGNAEFTRALGLEMDGSGYGMGIRSQRYSALVEDGVVKTLHVEAPGKFEVSKAEVVLGDLS
jgi:glutaredoxin/glutathione-dependent peroxiredoxin